MSGGIAQYSQLGTFGGTVTTLPGVPAPSDAHVAVAGDIVGLQEGYNGATWDQWRNNTDFLMAPSTARTAQFNSATQINYNARGIHLYVNVTSVGTGNLTVIIYEITPTTIIKVALLLQTITDAGLKVYSIYPTANVAGSGITATINAVLPRRFQVFVGLGDGSSWTYSVEASLIL